jgi:hypothetical protein
MVSQSMVQQALFCNKDKVWWGVVLMMHAQLCRISQEMPNFTVTNSECLPNYIDAQITRLHGPITINFYHDEFGKPVLIFLEQYQKWLLDAFLYYEIENENEASLVPPRAFLTTCTEYIMEVARNWNIASHRHPNALKPSTKQQIMQVVVAARLLLR